MANIECASPYAMFLRLDFRKEESISIDGILKFLEDNRIYDVSREEIQYMIGIFDSD